MTPTPSPSWSLPRGLFRVLCALLFCTGITSLVFQVLWLRGFSIVLGSTIQSMACVVTVFMFGLALGSLWMSRVLPRVSRLTARPALTYGVIELCVGLSGAAVTWLLFRHQTELLALSPSATAPLSSRIPGQLALCFALIALPTVLMGMTLPVVSLLTEDPKQVPVLYGFNTLGAATGSVIASFVFIYYFGVLAAAAIAASINALIFATGFLLRNRLKPAPAGAESSAHPHAHEAGLAKPGGEEANAFSAPLLLTLATFSGFVSLSCEIAWTRFLSLCFGNRVYVTSITLGLILLFMGQASRMGSAFLREGRPVWRVMLWACALSLVSLSVAMLLEPRALQAVHPGIVIAFMLTLVVFPATTVGLIFPMTLAARVGEGAEANGWVARVYGVNTLASLAGSLLSGYVLISVLGSNGILGLNAALLAVAGAWLGWRFRARLRVREKAIGAVAVMGLLLVLLPGSRTVPAVIDPARRVMSDEDPVGLFNVEDAGNGRLRVINDRTALVYLYGERSTQFVQESQAYFPLLYAPKLDKVAVIGSGYGITAGAFSRVEEVGQIDAVEIVPALVEHADLFGKGNYRYDRNPRVKVHVTDGRHFLATAPDRYDVISINVTDPYIPGCSSLFSREFYEQIRDRLSDGGIVAQHLFGPDLVSLVHGLAAVFPYVKAIPAYQNGMTVIASMKPLEPRQRALFASRYDDGRKLFDHILPGHGLDELEKLIAEGDRKVEALMAQPALFRDSDEEPVLEFRRIPGRLGMFYSNL